MDTKLRNSKRFKNQISILLIIILSVLNLIAFYVIQGKIDVQKEAEQSRQTSLYDSDIILLMYHANQVLYREAQEKVNGIADVSVLDVFSDRKEEESESTNVVSSDVNDKLETYLEVWEAEAASIFNGFDYYISVPDQSVSSKVCAWKNTDYDLEKVFENPTEENFLDLQENYKFFVVMQFDEKGIMSIDHIYSADNDGDIFIKYYQQFERDNTELEDTIKESGFAFRGIRNMKVIYALPNNSDIDLKYSIVYNWNSDYYKYQDNGGHYLYFGSVLLIAIMAFAVVLSNKNVTEGEERVPDEKLHLPVFLKYPTELSIFILICMLNIFRRFQYDMLYESGFISLTNTFLARKFKEITVEEVVTTVIAYIMICVFYLMIYWAVYNFAPVFRLGLRKYLKEYSFCFHFLPWLKATWKRYTDMIRHVDFTKKTNRVIFRLVIVNFIVLSVISCFWIFGIVPLFIYSVIIYVMMRRYYINVSNDYQILLKAMGRIADGELDTTIEEDIGLFEPFKNEMSQIQDGFKKAVNEEVKSQRMRTELITNVSHDLKTPLTAITTYIELLQREDITEEERAKYIATLQNKAHRLNVLIEDLFEVSKATTDNITLDLHLVDVVELIKQVGVEFEDKLEDRHLTVNYHLPTEKIYLLLDGQKTYRIFENLYGNIIKYAMPGSRVYIDVEKKDNRVEIVLRNISATPLDFRAEEITERFVRGDMARNTEGAGLGLAIAKSFTELQKGKFRIEADGDLFKVYLSWIIDVACDTNNANSMEEIVEIG